MNYGEGRRDDTRKKPVCTEGTVQATSDGSRPHGRPTLGLWAEG